MRVVSLEEKRSKRLIELHKWAKEHDVSLFDEILRHARDMYPFVAEKTVRSYATAVKRLIDTGS